MWTVIYLTQDKNSALRLQKILEDAGVLVKLRPLSKGEGGGCFEILVPESEINEAHEIIINNNF